MSNYRDIIKGPIVTEKSAALAETNTIVFSVEPKANKTQIKQAVEKIFNVKVEEVRTINVKPQFCQYHFRRFNFNSIFVNRIH